MTKLDISLKSFGLAALPILLAACGAKAPVEASQVSLPVTQAVQTEMSAAKSFQSACTDKITAKMIEPKAAKIAYAPLSGTDGYQAEVKLLNRESGGTVAMDFTCVRTADGDVVTKLVSD